MRVCRILPRVSGNGFMEERLLDARENSVGIGTVQDPAASKQDAAGL